MAAKQVFLPFSLILALAFIPPLLFSAEAAAVPFERLNSLRVVKKVNKNGPFLGLITVYAPEDEAFFKTGVFRPDPRHPFVDLSGRRFRIGKVEGKKVIYVKCGVGLVNAAAATQQMLDLFDIKGIIHFGISGNANSSMRIGDVTIPYQFAQTGLWDWLKPNATMEPNDFAQFNFKSYNDPKGGENQLGKVGYSTEQFYSVSGEVNVPQRPIWFDITKNWLHVASHLQQGMKLEQCANSTLCLPYKPKLVVGLKGATSNFFIDNAAYTQFLFKTFGVTSLDMESSAVVMICLSSGYPVIAIRGLSDLAGTQEGDNTIRLFGSLAALNTAKVVISFIKSLPGKYVSGF
ncbi:bark storage protein A-like isoform X1 [Lycium ferocissimum]|uniref:bark storage protein A-like isoform X1 n=1 Tax=Lycium ferocissimum TaxID=112874 RepID=UPI0028166A92|nr:bark storage protein A-like isoform X1 [Lycium ferocissimum]